jgi:hypothetical protein
VHAPCGPGPRRAALPITDKPAASSGWGTKVIFGLIGRQLVPTARVRAAASITVRVPLAIRHRLGRKTVVTPVQEGMLAVATRADPTLVRALTRAFRYQRLLDEERYA